jgi:hypothetical protein
MHESNPGEALAADLEALCDKHKLDSGMIAVTQEDHFLIITCNMSSKGIRTLGHTLLECVPSANTVLN